MTHPDPPVNLSWHAGKSQSEIDAENEADWWGENDLAWRERHGGEAA